MNISSKTRQFLSLFTGKENAAEFTLGALEVKLATHLDMTLMELEVREESRSEVFFFNARSIGYKVTIGPGAIGLAMNGHFTLEGHPIVDARKDYAGCVYAGGIREDGSIFWRAIRLEEKRMVIEGRILTVLATALTRHFGV